MKRRIIQVLNWEKYQSRTDKDMPWCKLWGSLFDRPWFQQIPDSCKFLAFVFLDLARKTGNRITEEYVLIGYLKGNYGYLNGIYGNLNEIKGNKELFIHCKLLSDNGFLSDNTSDIEDKIREDKKREEIVQSKKDVLSEDFNRFYDIYPKKQGKADALKAFLKLSPSTELLSQILDVVRIWSTNDNWLKDDGKYVPLPATWLRGRRWEDEIIIKRSANEPRPFPKDV